MKINRLFLIVSSAFLALLLTGCSTVKVQDYAKQEPKFELFDYFKGQTKAWGQFQDRGGLVIRRFTVDITGTVSADGKQLILDERFIYNDGEKEQRIWTINKTGDDKFSGTAGDVIGEARGESAGNAFNWAYVLDLPYKDSTIHVNFDDWMYLQDDTTLLNRAFVTKWGFKVGEVTLFFKKDLSE